LESISPSELAVELLNHCLRGSRWPEDLLTSLVAEALDEEERVAAPATRALFSILVERLGDLFEPRLCDTYADLFSKVIAQAMPELNAAELARRYRAVREVRPVTKTPRNVFVLSRVTLGADIAVTSIVMDAARQRFPDAQLWFVGPKKAWELFEKSPGWKHAPVGYGRESPGVQTYWKISNDPQHPRVGFAGQVELPERVSGRHWLGLRLHSRDGSVEDWSEQPIDVVDR